MTGIITGTDLMTQRATIFNYLNKINQVVLLRRFFMIVSALVLTLTGEA